MIGPSIDPADVGASGLLWLFLSYGYVLYYSSNLISEGSEYLLLVPEIAGLVGGVVLPLLGAVPDGAIILFSGLGDFETAQETLSVGVGALAGSTIMLLTVPFAASVMAGRVDFDPTSGLPNYMKQPKLDMGRPFMKQLATTGVAVTEPVKHSAIVMMATTLPYFLIQVPASFMHGPQEEVAAGEKYWALGGLITCLAGLFIYLAIQLKASRADEDQHKRVATVKKMLKLGQISLSGAMAAKVREGEQKSGAAAAGRLGGNGSSDYQAINEGSVRNDGIVLYPPDNVAQYLREILTESFYSYDNNRSGELDRRECFVFFKDFNENVSEEDMDKLFNRYDTDKSGFIDLDEFIGLAYSLIKLQETSEGVGGQTQKPKSALKVTTEQISQQALSEEEEEEIPEEFTNLPPEQQQAQIKKKAFLMLLTGTLLVLAFSDPMVDVMQEIAVRCGLNSFYVSFVLAPLASNASELLSSIYYASKKTRKTITVSLSTVLGAAALNNTFCLSIFFLLIAARGLAWQYTAETISIVLVELLIGYFVQSECISLGKGAFIFCVFPLSLVLVATLEAFGLD